jgi:hypothetical protein
MWPQRSQVSALAIDQSLQADGALVQQGVYVPAARRPSSSRTMRRKLYQRLSPPMPARGRLTCPRFSPSSPAAWLPSQGRSCDRPTRTGCSARFPAPAVSTGFGALETPAKTARKLHANFLGGGCSCLTPEVMRRRRQLPIPPGRSAGGGAVGGAAAGCRGVILIRAHTVPTICPQLQLTHVSYRDALCSSGPLSNP